MEIEWELSGQEAENVSCPLALNGDNGTHFLLSAGSIFEVIKNYSLHWHFFVSNAIFLK